MGLDHTNEGEDFDFPIQYDTTKDDFYFDPAHHQRKFLHPYQSLRNEIYYASH